MTQRVVSLTCSNTEIVCALGCADRLVGVDADSDFPDEVVARLPRVGRDLQIDAQEVQRLRPDLVLASLTVPGHEKVVAAIEATGLRLYAPETITLEDTYTDITTIGDLLGVSDRAGALVADMQRQLAELTVTKRDGPRLLVQWWPKPVIAPGRRSWVDELLRLVGARNPIGDRDVKSTPLSDAEVAALQPDAVVVSWCGVHPDKYRPDVILDNESWRGLPFVEQQRVFCIPEVYLGRPGPRLVEGARALAAVVRAVAPSR